MAELVRQVQIAAPPQQVWAALVDWDRQGEWMLFTDVRAGTQDGQGIGGELAATTGVPLGRRRFGVLDRMLITGWEPPFRVDVRHLGRVVRGTGSFEVRPSGAGTLFVWTESLDLPLGALGQLGWRIVRPFFGAGVTLSLRRFADFTRRH